MLLSMRLSKFYRVVPTCTRSGLVHGIELDKAGRPNLSMAARHDTFEIMDGDRDAAEVFYGIQPLLFDRTPRTVSIVAWLYDMEANFRKLAPDSISESVFSCGG
ncbi:hypothetical protein TIFTF001_039220 [Ficus carica]|uniref:Uncharacterized protein n=1 Tax=Ficus carica TaxID=3494 RepID=A0AA88JEV8_FICCA|nr:hypothetical protein TIFTF001_039220 [Ficus carica]